MSFRSYSVAFLLTHRLNNFQNSIYASLRFFHLTEFDFLALVIPGAA